VARLIQRMEHFLALKDPRLPVETKRILLKEFLQAHVLGFLYNHPTYRSLNFYGGTCLHIVYDLNRLSEDLDLDNGAQINLSTLESDLLDSFKHTFGYQDLTIKPQRSAQGILRLLLKFPILYPLGLSPHANEALHLKVEISHHNQVAEVINTPVFLHGQSFVPAHFSLETMMAGKMIACIERNFQQGSADVFIKGRDFYDLLWFMQQKIQPLEEKLAQDGQIPYTTKTAMLTLREKIHQLKTSNLAADLLPMFESRVFIEAWLESFHQNFDRYYIQYT